MQFINDIADFSVFMSSLWLMLPIIVQNMILAVASLSIVLGLVKLFD